MSTGHVFTCVAVSVDVLDIEEQQEQAEADEGCYCATQQEGIAALTVDDLQEKGTHTQFIMSVFVLRSLTTTLISVGNNVMLLVGSQHSEMLLTEVKVKVHSRVSKHSFFFFNLHSKHKCLFHHNEAASYTVKIKQTEYSKSDKQYTEISLVNQVRTLNIESRSMLN